MNVVDLKTESTAPLKQKTLSELAFDQIARRIVSGDISPNTRLVESELANELGISRAPVREALAELVRQGLAYDVVRRGVFVKRWTKRDLWEIATLRANLEGLAIRYAVPNLTDEDIEFVHYRSHEMETVARAGDLGRLMELSEAIHERFVQRCSHNRLQTLLHDMNLQLRIFQLMTGGSDLAAQPDKLHMKLYHAIRERDPELAYRTVYDHYMERAERALASLSDDEGVSTEESLRNSETSSFQASLNKRRLSLDVTST